jgi:hypothetical protein
MLFRNRRGIAMLAGDRAMPEKKLSRVSPELFLLAVALVLAAACATRGGAGLVKLLPGDEVVPGWRLKGEPQRFAGQDLFTYIDGGADIYIEYGFSEVLVQDYEGPGGKTISAEVFAMSDPGAAFGMYAFKKSDKGRAVGSGGRAQIEDYYLNLWKGRYLVTLTGFDSDPETLAGLEALARASDARLGGAVRTPAFLEALPGKDRIKPSLGYFRGPLGLNAVYPRVSREVSGFEEGAAADYDTGLSVIVLRYGDGRAAGHAYERLKSAMSDTERFFEFQEIGRDAAAASDAKGATLYAALRGGRLWLVRGTSRRAILSFLSSLGRP